MLYVLGVSTPMPSERKPYMTYIVRVWSSLPFEEAESFSYMPYIIGVATLTLFQNSWGKKYGCGYPSPYFLGKYSPTHVLKCFAFVFHSSDMKLKKKKIQ